MRKKNIPHCHYFFLSLGIFLLSNFEVDTHLGFTITTKYHTVGTVPKSNRKNRYPPGTQSDGVKLVK